jgi:hypothetical protein
MTKIMMQIAMSQVRTGRRLLILRDAVLRTAPQDEEQKKESSS